MTPPDSGAGLPASIDELIAAMTFDEKVAQLQIGYRPDLDEAADLVRSGIGAVFWPMSAAATNRLQRVARDETPHGIPLLVGLDVVHAQRTTFPIPLAQAASFDPAVARLDAEITGREAASGGVNWTFSPMLDVTYDPRWGRIAEGFGEDPYLTSVLGAAKVAGYQGPAIGRGSVLACLKHFVAYGQPEGGRDYNTVDISERRLREVHLVPFRAAVEAGAATVMAAFNTIAGRPCHANRWLLTEVLKEEWGFEGLVVGDADGVMNLVPHGVAADSTDALRQALSAGLDVEMGAGEPPAGRRGRLAPEEIDPARLDDAVRRLLRLKWMLGLFDDPFVDERAELTAPTAEARAAARLAAERCAVLLRNDGTLPLARRPLRVLLTGPYATSTDHLGCWVQPFALPTESLADALGRLCTEWSLTVLPGATFLGDRPDLRDAAVAAAADHDVVIAAVGEPSSLSGEAASRSDLCLPGDQDALLGALVRTGTPVVAVLANGRPLVLGSWLDEVSAVLEVWHSGLEAPTAIAHLLTGVANPGGRLPASFPRRVGQIPIYHHHENTGRPATQGGSLHVDQRTGLVGPADTAGKYTSKYLDLDLGPELEFGHGLSYTTFEHRDLVVEPTVSRADLAAGSNVAVTVDVVNTGALTGDVVTMLFVHDLVASLAQPVRKLRRFQRTTLAPGEARRVSFELSWDDLAIWTVEGRRDLEPGEFDLHVGEGLGGALRTRLTVTGERTDAINARSTGWR